MEYPNFVGGCHIQSPGKTVKAGTEIFGFVPALLRVCCCQAGWQCFYLSFSGAISL